MRRLRLLLLYARSADNATFSYHHAWPDQFRAHPRVQCTAINLSDRRYAMRARAAVLGRLWRGDAVVLLHSVFANASYLSSWMADAIAGLSAPTALFMGNEYKQMPEKLALCDRLGISLLVTQTNAPRVHQLYRERLDCAVMGLPNTGLDATAFHSRTPPQARPIDLGYRSDVHAYYLGHTERENIAAYFTSHAARLRVRVDISTDSADRLIGPAWADFLERCRGQIGTEAGTDYFELTDDTRNRVNAYMLDNPAATFGDVWDRFFRDYPNPVPMRIISGRNIEAAGTRTAQVLMEGHYDGYFQPDVHYIPLKKDFSNADEAIAKFRDAAFVETITENAYRVAMEQLTYTRLIDTFADALEPLV